MVGKVCIGERWSILPLEGGVTGVLVRVASQGLEFDGDFVFCGELEVEAFA